MSDREFHPLANKFPMLLDDELKELAEDIKKNGLNNPIRLYEEKILDGRNRYIACKMVNITPKLIKFEGDNKKAIDFVISENLKRRHLTNSQRAMIAADLAEKPIGKPTKEERENPTTMSTEEAADTMKVSKDSVKKAKNIIKKSPEKAKAVRDGIKTVGTADKEIKKESGKITPRDEAIKLGENALNNLKRVSEEFKPLVYKTIREWLNTWYKNQK